MKSNLQVTPTPDCGAYIACDAPIITEAWRLARAERAEWLAVLQDADPDDYRQRVRAQLWSASPDRAELDALADSAEFDGALPRTQSWLAAGFCMLVVAPADERPLTDEEQVQNAATIARVDRLYQRALTLHPDDFMLNFDYALALTQLGPTDPGRWKEAVGYFRAGLAIRPRTSGMWRWLGIAYRELGDFEQSIAALNRSIDNQNDHAPTWVDLGRAKAASGDLDGAIESYRQAMDLDEDLPEALCFFGLALMEQGRLTEAWVQLRRGHQLGSSNPTWEHPSAQWIAECEQRIASGIRRSSAGGAGIEGQS